MGQTWGKPASVRSTATGCQLPIRLPPCGVCRPCLERSEVTSDRGAQTRGLRCCGIEEQKRGINILPLIPQPPPPPRGTNLPPTITYLNCNNTYPILIAEAYSSTESIWLYPIIIPCLPLLCLSDTRAFVRARGRERMQRDRF